MSEPNQMSPLILECRNLWPKIGEGTFLAPNSTIIGDVEIGKKCSIWYNVVIRGDVHSIRIGDETNIQDNTVIHATYQKCGTHIARRVSIGHSVILHGCTIGEGTLIGMGAIIMDLAHIPKHCLVGAGSLVTENQKFEEGWLILGRPAKAIRPLKPEELKALEQSADNYLLYKTWYGES